MSASTSDNSTIPAKYAGLAPALVPLMEQPAEWFQEPTSFYETAFGPFGDIVDLTPEAVTFRAAVYDETPEYREAMLTKWKSSERVSGRLTVPNETAAQNHDEPTVWLNDFGRHVQVYEHVPFDSRVTTVDDFRTEINSLVAIEPGWGELFDTARQVAREMGLDRSVDHLSDTEFETVYEVLEIGRDDTDQLTPDQQAVLNEAHVIVQEMQEIRDADQ